MKSNKSIQQHLSTWVELILPLAVPTTYTYDVPLEMIDEIKVGCRAEVNFGKSKKYAGIIKSIHHQKPAYPTKPILEVIDDEPILYDHQLTLWNWISEYYICSEGEVMAAALPAHLKLSSETILIFNEEYGEDFTALDDEEYLLAEALLIKKQLTISEAQQVVNVSHLYPVIIKLIEKKICIVWESLSEKYKQKTEKFVILNPNFDNDESLNTLMDELSRAPKQLALLLTFIHLQKTEGTVSQSDLLKKSGASSAQLKALEDKTVFIIQKRNVTRLPVFHKTADISISLSAAQHEAFTKINEAFNDKNVCLLHGITSSGKTQIYTQLISDCIRSGQQVLYLLPEITLTAQIIRRLQTYFGNEIAIYHSKFNNNERVEIWNRTKSGEIKIILGARSALFLPFQNLGLVIVDEEHDSSFKQQDPAPRYHARDAAIYYASLFSAKVLLGSATPSLESYYNAQKGKYALVKLNERFGGVQLPEISIIDTKTVAASKKGKVILSPQLKFAMEEQLALDHQIILFQNRRGYAPLLICNTCGYIPQCEQCSVTLTLHKYSNKLHCHYCGNSYSRPVACVACGSVNWKEKNFGTEKVEEELSLFFPKQKVARMDVDAVKGKYAHDTLIKLFEQRQIDILVGTQMVAKGLDFDNIGLVGILDADGLLGFADFRVNERAFQLMEQVSGRAGRKEKRGKVLIQAANANHPILTFVQHHDYENFSESELESRRLFIYPPFCRLIRITVKHGKKEVADEASELLGNLLTKDFKNVSGPAAPVISRIRNLYLMELLIKLSPSFAQLKIQKRILMNAINLIKSKKGFTNVVFNIDVDPY